MRQQPPGFTTPGTRATGRLVIAAVAAAVLAAVPALGAAAFSPPVDVSVAGRDADNPQIAINAHGLATITWDRSNGSKTVVQQATRAMGDAAFSDPVDLSDATQNADEQAIATGPDGSTTIVWRRNNGSNWIIQQATRGAGASTFSAPTNVSATGVNASTPAVAIGPNGTTTVAWKDTSGAHSVIKWATRAPGEVAFSTPASLSDSAQNAIDPQVAIGPDGTTTIIWVRNDGSRWIAQQATRPAGQPAFLNPTDLSLPGLSASGPQIGMAPDGTTTVTWKRGNGSDFAIQQATRPAGQSAFPDPVNVSASGAITSTPQMATAPDGATTITWTRPSGGDNIVQQATRAAGQSAFSDPVNLSATGQSASNAWVAMGPDGATAITWQRSDGTTTRIQQAARAAGQAGFSDPVDVSNAGQQAQAPQVAIAPDGATTLTWLRMTGSAGTTQASWTGPTLATLTVSRGGTGTGTVTSSPAGITCGTSCSAWFPIGSSVALTAAPGADSALSSWGGACTGSTLTCTLTITGTAAVTAEFGPPPPAGAAPASPAAASGPTPTLLRFTASEQRDGIPVSEDGMVTLALRCPATGGTCTMGGSLLTTSVAARTPLAESARRAMRIGSFSGIRVRAGATKLVGVRISPVVMARLQARGVRVIGATAVITSTSDGMRADSSRHVKLRIPPLPRLAVTG